MNGRPGFESDPQGFETGELRGDDRRRQDRMSIAQHGPRHIPRLEQGDAVTFSNQVPSHGQTAQSGAQHGDPLRPARQPRHPVFASRQTDAGLLEGGDTDGVAGFATFAARFTRPIADAPHQAGQGHGPRQCLPTLIPSALLQMADEGADIHVNRAGGGAGRRLLLDAAPLPLSEFVLIHVTLCPSTNGQLAVCGPTPTEFSARGAGTPRRNEMDTVLLFQGSQHLFRKGRQMADTHTTGVVDGIDHGHMR